MKPSEILSNVPQSMRFSIGENNYHYATQSIKQGLITFSANGDALKEIYFEDAPDDFKQRLAHNASEQTTLALIAKTLGTFKITEDDAPAYVNAWRLLYSPNFAFFRFCMGIVETYHALDTELAQTFLLGTTRARYSSTSALLHNDCTGDGGAGKNDLVNRVTALIPSRFLDMFSSITPMAIYYETKETNHTRDGKTVVHINKDRFKGKIIIITEAADAAGYAALKALAETDEAAEFTHMTTVNGQTEKLTLRGPRCVVVTSVDGINDPQIKRRFIHSSISEDSLENKKKKLEVAQYIMLNEADIRDDPRIKIAHAGINLIFSTDGLVFEDIEPRTKELIAKLNQEFVAAGYSITNLKQFFSLCQCSAIWNRFNRGYLRVTIEDVNAAWFLLSSFEKETITKTTRHGIAVLETIERLSREYDARYEDDHDKYDTEAKRPTRSEIAKDSKVPQATVYRLLRLKEDANGKLGELLELGYVVTSYRDNQTVIELSDLGETVLRKVPSNVTLEDGETFSPIEPRAAGLETDITEPKTLEVILSDYENRGEV
jgi:hypothetical protein